MLLALPYSVSIVSVTDMVGCADTVGSASVGVDIYSQRHEKNLVLSFTFQAYYSSLIIDSTNHSHTLFPLSISQLSDLSSQLSCEATLRAVSAPLDDYARTLEHVNSTRHALGMSPMTNCHAYSQLMQLHQRWAQMQTLAF